MEITLLDTGYLTRDREGTPEADADRAGYDGSSTVTGFVLKGASIKESLDANLDTNSIPGSTSFAELNKVSFENPKYVIKCILAKDDGTTGFEYSQLYQLRRLIKTDGVKILYPSSVTDTYKTIIELNGAYNGANGEFQGSGKEVSAGTPYIVGRVKDIGISDDSNKKYFEIQITFIEE